MPCTVSTVTEDDTGPDIQPNKASFFMKHQGTILGIVGLFAGFVILREYGFFGEEKDEEHYY